MGRRDADASTVGASDMTNLIKETVESWSPDYIDQVICEYEDFEAEGKIGDCILREQARQLLSKNSFSTGVVKMMTDIAMWCYRIRYQQLSSEVERLYNQVEQLQTE